jgi:hypothetical protein
LGPVKYLHTKAILGHKKTFLPGDLPRSGYGSRIPTHHMIKLGRWWYRVYVIQKGNAGSAYVLIKGQRFFLREGDLL